MKEIPLSKGKVALVDDLDFDRLSQWKWYCLLMVNGFGEKCYAVREKRDKKSGPIYMHREILGVTDSFVDHQDGNGLNNQRSNLRPCTNGQNQRNRRIRFDRYKGVWFSKHAKKWTAQISIGNKRVHLGYFDYSTDAAIAYNSAAIKHYGDFANLNQIPV